MAAKDPELVVLSIATRDRVQEAMVARARYLTCSVWNGDLEKTRDAWVEAMNAALMSLDADRAMGIGSLETRDPQIALLAEIDDERRRLGLSVQMPVRIGWNGTGLAWAALSRNPSSRFCEGACAGRSVEEALRSLLSALRDTASIEPAAEAE